jgi:hypothetical protein
VGEVDAVPGTDLHEAAGQTGQELVPVWPDLRLDRPAQPVEEAGKQWMVNLVRHAGQAIAAR